MTITEAIELQQKVREFKKLRDLGIIDTCP